MSHHPLISLRDVCFAYEDTTILSHINLSIHQGDFIGIFGPNGGGKTTLIRVLMGFLKPTSGTITYRAPAPTMSYVPQTARIDRQFPITAEEVVQMGCLSKLSRWGKLPREEKDRALAALEKVGMLDNRHYSFGRLSGGQAQRVLIARALVCEPSILFLDEPTASVDPRAEQEILSILDSLKSRITILMVTHDLQTILEKVGKLLCVHRTAHTLAPSQACEHFGLGLYHSPSFPKD